MPYILADTPYYMTYFDGDDNCVYMKRKERPMTDGKIKQNMIDNLMRKTPCSMCTHLCICSKTDEYRKFIEDVVTVIGDIPEFLDIAFTCKHYLFR